MPDPLVSIAVITYNHEKFIAECLDSVLSQDYGNIEIVVADDGSTDGSHTILREYEKKYPGKFILRLSAKNQGITRNTNVALYACSGKYIAWLGGDDLMLPGKLKKQVAYMERHPDCRITYHNLEVFDSETQQRLYYFNNPLNSYQGDVSVVIRRGTFNGACST
ncbi:MAG: glycosyltransferase family 2 protein, partial [Nitrospirota bacterium]